MIGKEELLLHLGIMKDFADDCKTKINFFHPKDETAPYGYTNGKTIHLNIDIFDEKPDFFYSVFFHEMSHVLQVKNGWFNKFYTFNTSYEYDMRLRLKIEKFTDRMAFKIMRDYLPGLRFFAAYDDRLNKKLVGRPRKVIKPPRGRPIKNKLDIVRIPC